jgi:hypothetical protein
MERTGSRGRTRTAAAAEAVYSLLEDTQELPKHLSLTTPNALVSLKIMQLSKKATTISDNPL